VRSFFADIEYALAAAAVRVRDEDVDDKLEE